MISTSSASDRLILTVIGSAIAHAIVIFSVSFNVFSPPTNAPVNQLDITLVHQQTEQIPEEPAYLAQANNDGGGEAEEKTPEPTEDLPVPIIEETAVSTDITTAVLTEAEQEPIPVEPVLPETVIDNPVPPETPATEPEVVPPVIEPEAEPQTATEKVVTETAERQVEATEQLTDALTEQIDMLEMAAPKLSGAELIARARTEIGSLQNTLDNNSKALSETPKKRRISASTKEYSAAAYMRAWEMKVERIGNMNYPQEAKDKGINGSLMLSVDIQPDGSVPPDGIVISRSSGHQILDDAAVRIVRLAAPYAAIPEDVLNGSDMLTIIRTWKFESLRGMSTR